MKGFPKGQNPNHVKKGETCTVDPIRGLEEIARIKAVLRDNPRDLAIFTLGINNGLRGQDLVSLKVGQVRNCKPGDEIRITELKTKKRNVVAINKASHRALKAYLEKADLKDTDRLFNITPIHLNALVKKWTKKAGVNGGRYGAHTLRKTFGFIQRTQFGVGIEILQTRFNHRSPATTLGYLGITREEVSAALLNEI